MIEQLAGGWNYIIVLILMMTGLFMVIARANLVKKMIGLSIFQTSVFGSRKIRQIFGGRFCSILIYSTIENFMRNMPFDRLAELTLDLNLLS